MVESIGLPFSIQKSSFLSLPETNEKKYSHENEHEQTQNWTPTWHVIIKHWLARVCLSIFQCTYLIPLWIVKFFMVKCWFNHIKIYNKIIHKFNRFTTHHNSIEIHSNKFSLNSFCYLVWAFPSTLTPIVNCERCEHSRWQRTHFIIRNLFGSRVHCFIDINVSCIRNSNINCNAKIYYSTKMCLNVKILEQFKWIYRSIVFNLFWVKEILKLKPWCITYSIILYLILFNFNHFWLQQPNYYYWNLRPVYYMFWYKSIESKLKCVSKRGKTQLHNQVINEIVFDADCEQRTVDNNHLMD